MNAAIVMAAVVLSQAPASALTLDEALRAAREGNRDLRVAQARLEQAQLLSRRAWANHLPTLAAGASYTRNSEAVELGLPTALWARDMTGFPLDTASENGPRFDPNQKPSAENPPGRPSSTTLIVPAEIKELELQKEDQLGVQVTLSQPLIVPALWPAIRNAYLAERVAQLTVENARREVLFAVAQVYYGAASLKENVAVHERLLAQAQAHERDAEAQVRAGAVPKIVLLRAQIDRARAEQDLVRARNSYASAKLALATLLAREADFEVVRPDEPRLPEAGRVSEESALAERPDVKAARATLDLAGRQERAVLYKYAPSVGLQAAYRLANVKGFVDSYSSWSVGVGLNWTLWDGGVREVELAEGEAKVAEARAGLEGLELKAREEVRRAVLDLESARANRAKAEEQLKLARENEQMVRNNFRAGVATALEASDAESSQRNAEVGFVAETLSAQLAALRLLKAVGAFDPS